MWEILLSSHIGDIVTNAHILRERDKCNISVFENSK